MRYFSCVAHRNNSPQTDQRNQTGFQFILHPHQLFLYKHQNLTSFDVDREEKAKRIKRYQKLAQKQKDLFND